MFNLKCDFELEKFWAASDRQTHSPFTNYQLLKLNLNPQFSIPFLFLY